MEINECQNNITALNSILDAIEGSNNQLVTDALVPSALSLTQELNEILRELTTTVATGNNSDFTLEDYQVMVRQIAEVLSRYAKVCSNNKGSDADGVPASAISEESSSEIIDAVPPELRADIQEALSHPTTSDRAYTLDSSVMKKLTRPKAQNNDIINDIVLSSKANATMTVFEGYITPYERELLEAIYKAKQDGQIAKGKIFCTVGQLYRTMRGTSGMPIPLTTIQKESILNDLKELSADSRKIKFETTNAKEILGDFMMSGGRLQIVSFNEIYGKIRGQDETLIIFEDTPFLLIISDQLRMFESFSQRLKVVQEPLLTWTLSDGNTISGKNDNECEKKLKKAGYSNSDIVKRDPVMTNVKMTKGRISLRNAIFSFIYSYYRTRSMNKPHSNKINYEDLFEKCEVGAYRSDKIAAKEFIGTIMNHLVTNEVITSWNEYKNDKDRKASGVEFYANPDKIFLPTEEEL